MSQTKRTRSARRPAPADTVGTRRRRPGPATAVAPAVATSADDPARHGEHDAGRARRNLHEEAANRIRTLILDGALEAGTRISEKSLCERFGISRTPVREAIKSLASEGLIEMTPNRGASVTELSLGDLEAAFPVMGGLEALSGELAARAMRDDEIGHVRKLHEAMVAHFTARRLQPYFEVNRQIHEAILAGARNPVLSDHYAQLAARMRLARYRANMSDVRWRQAVSEHEQIINALERRQAKTLGRILRSHLDNKFEVVKADLLA